MNPAWRLPPDLEKGSYTIREVALPEVYTGTLVELSAEVQSDHTTELSCTNTPIQGKVRIEKKDSLTGEVLAGATFTISDVDGSVVATLTTGADGSAESGLLRYGEYTITETAARNTMSTVASPKPSSFPKTARPTLLPWRILFG